MIQNIKMLNTSDDDVIFNDWSSSNCDKDHRIKVDSNSASTKLTECCWWMRCKDIDSRSNNTANDAMRWELEIFALALRESADLKRWSETKDSLIRDSERVSYFIILAMSDIDLRSNDHKNMSDSCEDSITIAIAIAISRKNRDRFEDIDVNILSFSIMSTHSNAIDFCLLLFTLNWARHLHEFAATTCDLLNHECESWMREWRKRENARFQRVNLCVYLFIN